MAGWLTKNIVDAAALYLFAMEARTITRAGYVVADRKVMIERTSVFSISCSFVNSVKYGLLGNNLTCV
jgi:hypothetical protein